VVLGPSRLGYANKPARPAPSPPPPRPCPSGSNAGGSAVQAQPAVGFVAPLRDIEVLSHPPYGRDVTRRRRFVLNRRYLRRVGGIRSEREVDGAASLAGRELRRVMIRGSPSASSVSISRPSAPEQLGAGCEMKKAHQRRRRRRKGSPAARGAGQAVPGVQRQRLVAATAHLTEPQATNGFPARLPRPGTFTAAGRPLGGGAATRAARSRWATRAAAGRQVPASALEIRTVRRPGDRPRRVVGPAGRSAAPGGG